MHWTLFSVSQRTRFALSLFLACHWLASSASGELTHYVPFDAGYTVGSILNGSGGSDLGFGSNTWFDGGTESAVVAGNLSPPIATFAAGNSARTAESDFDLAYYTMDQNNNGVNGEADDRLQAGEHWLSFVARAETPAFFGGLSLVKFFGPEILYIGKVGGEGGTEWGIDPGGNAMGAGGDITQDTLLVAKLTLGPVRTTISWTCLSIRRWERWLLERPTCRSHSTKIRPTIERSMKFGWEAKMAHSLWTKFGSELALPTSSFPSQIHWHCFFLGSSRGQQRLDFDVLPSQAPGQWREPVAGRISPPVSAFVCNKENLVSRIGNESQ